MLSAADWAEMRADLLAIRGDNPVSITIRRGATTLAAQTVRIARTGGGGSAVGSAGSARAQESRGRVIVMGATTLDIQPGDRFNDAAGELYQVVIVRPNRRAAVMAEAEIVE